jgi:uncharacterized membrane protein
VTFNLSNFRLAWVALFTLPFAAIIAIEKFGLRIPHIIVAAITLRYLNSPIEDFRKVDRTILFGSLILFLGASLSQFFSITLSGIDFSIFDWMLTNQLVKGEMYSPIYDVNHLGVHQSWIMFVLLPLRALIASPLLLVIIHALVLWAAVIPLRALARNFNWQPQAITLLSAVYLLNPFVGTTLNGGFRIESFIPLALLSFLYFWWTASSFRTPAMLLSLILCLSIKEDMALYFGGFFLYQAFFGKDRRLFGFILFAACCAVFYFNVAIIRPQLLTRYPEYGSGFLSFWSNYGQTLPEITKGVALHPFKALGDIFGSGVWKIYLPFALLPFMSLQTMWAAAPGIVMLGTATSYPAMHSFGTYYPLAIYVLALAGLVQTIRTSHHWWFKALLVLAPLWFNGWIVVHRPDLKTYGDLKRLSKEFAHLEATKICAQAIAFPHLGYDPRLGDLGPRCISEKGAALVVIPTKSPYPYSRQYLDDLISQNPQKKIFGDAMILENEP